MNFDITHAIDWASVKLTGVTVTLCAITGNQLVLWFGILASATTIIYNGIRIYGEFRKLKQKK